MFIIVKVHILHYQNPSNINYNTELRDGERELMRKFVIKKGEPQKMLSFSAKTYVLVKQT